MTKAKEKHNLNVQKAKEKLNMNTATIQITPRAFGNIAAAAMSHGCDVTTYLVRTALTSALSAPLPHLPTHPRRNRPPCRLPSPLPLAAPACSIISLINIPP